MASRTFSQIGSTIVGTQDLTVLPSDGDFHTVFSMTLPEGVWVIMGYLEATAAFNEAFYCRMRKGTASIARENLDGRGGGGISLASITESDGTANINLWAYQGSGSNKTITGNLRAVKIA